MLQLKTPFSVYPSLQVGTHVLPEARVLVHVPGSLALRGELLVSHEEGLHTTLATSVPLLKHVTGEEGSYPLPHVVWHVPPAPPQRATT